MALTSAQQITQLYVGYFNRAPDPEGLNYWIGRLNSGEMNVQQIAQSFSEQPEALATYPYLRAPDLATPDAFITQIYQNAFNRAPDAEGLAYWKQQLSSGAVPVGDFIASVISGAQNTAEFQDLTTINNKTEVGLYYAETLLDNNVAWSLESAHEVLNGVTSASSSVAAAIAEVDQFVAQSNADVFNLTVNTDIATANIFNAGLEYTPGGNDRVNTLQDEDVLTGRGAESTLNATLGNANDNGATTITPTLNNIENINVRFTGSGANAVNNLDLQDATGVDAVNITGITDPNSFVAISNLNSVPSDLSLSNTNSPAAAVAFTFTRAALAGSEDKTNLTVSNVTTGALFVQENALNPREGVETINLVSAGTAGSENQIGALVVEGLETLNIAGTEDLTIGATEVVRGPNGRIEAERAVGGLVNVAGSLETIDASGLEGDLNIVLGDEVNAIKDGTSGVPVEFRYTGAQGDDTVVLTEAVSAAADAKFDGGEGDNTLVVLDSVAAGTYANFQDLDIRSQTDGFQAINVDTSLLGDLEAVSIRNEGQFNGVSSQNTLVTTLNKVNAEVAQNISVLHGTSGNNGVGQNAIEVNTVADATTVGLAIEEGVNTDPRFNLMLTTSDNVKNVTIHDNDSESNSVMLGNVAELTGTIKVTGGREGRFLNLDATANVYGYDETGGNNDLAGTNPAGSAIQNNPAVVGAERIVAAVLDASEFKGDLVARVSSGEASNVGAQTITAGSGNDTIIFDALNNVTAGLTIADSVTGGAGDDTLAFGGDTAITLGASEWTNVSEFETLRLLGNGVADDNARGAVNAYNLTLTNELVNQNGVANGNLRSIAIVNNNDQAQSVTQGANALTGANSGVTIDATGLAANRTFSYDGADGANVTADRFIMSDGNINSTAVINGGAIFVAGSGTGSHDANDDVLEVRNASTVTVADLANIRNVGTIEFTNSTTVTQNNQLVLDSETVDRLVNDTAAATAANVETLTVSAFDSQSGAATALNLNIKDVDLTRFEIDVTFGNGNNTLAATVTPAGADQTVVFGTGVDTLILSGNIGSATAPGSVEVTNGQITVFNSAGTQDQVWTVTDGDFLDLSGVVNGTISDDGTFGFTYVNTVTVELSAAGDLVGGEGSQSFVGFAGGVNTIIGGAGADIMSSNGGTTTFGYTALNLLTEQTGITIDTADLITDFVSGTDSLQMGTAGSAANFLAGAAAADFEAALADANAAFDGTVQYYLSSIDGEGLLFVDTDLNNSADAVIRLTGIDAGNFAFTDIVA